MIHFAASLVTLFLAGAAVESDYEMRLYRIDMPVADDVRSVLDQHLGKLLVTLLPEPERIPLGLQPLAVLDQSDWDGADLASLQGVTGENPMAMSQGAEF